MSQARSNLIAFRTFVAMACLAALAGCGGSGDTSTSTGAAAGGGGTTTSIPTVPANVAATAASAQTSLTWSASSGATSYNVKRATTNGGPYMQLAAPTTASYMDTGLTNGMTYYYVVSALNSAGESANSSQVSATPAASSVAVTAPANLAVTAGNAQASLTWSASSGATSYHVKRGTTNGGPYTQVGAPTSASYTDTGLTNGTTYYYVVTAVGSSGESGNSTQVSATPAAPSATTPPTPSGLTAVPGVAQTTLNWSASSGATSYHVKRGTANGGPYTQVGAPTSTSYTDTSLTNGTTYYYVVSAVNSAGESANSTQVNATPAAGAPPPSTTGTWTNVTPLSIDLTSNLSCGNYGTETVQPDPAHPSNLYTNFMCQGVWKSTDYGATWTGPINTGTNGATAGDCAGGITIAPSSTASVPTIYQSCIRGNGTGFWKSTDGGVSWTNYFVAPSGSSRQDYYPPVVDPYDTNHLLMVGHEMNYIVESTDGGQTWTNIAMASGMLEGGGTGAIFFINTGSSSTTHATWIWMAQASGGIYGTWRTTNSGGSWSQVDKNEHAHGLTQIYQPDNNGVVYVTGAYSAAGTGVLRSADYGQTWAHVGTNANYNVVFGTSKNVYAMFGYPVGPGGTNTVSFEVASQPGSGTYISPATPAGLNQGSAQVVVVNDGTHNIFLGAMWNNGLWRYVEP